MRIYFQIAPHEAYNDAAIYLAEGLSDLGVPFAANREFWRTETTGDAFLFRTEPRLRPADCDVVIFTTYWFHYIEPVSFRSTGAPMPEGLLAPDRRHRMVLLDPEDGYQTTASQSRFRAFDLVLRAKYNRATFNHANTVPWVLGFGERVLRATAQAPPFQARRRAIVQNFGFTHDHLHGAREAAQTRFLPRVAAEFPLDTRRTASGDVPAEPWAELMWRQTEGKHNPGYYEQLANAQCVACFCGDLIPGLPFNPSTCLAGGRRARLWRAFYRALSDVLGRTDRIIQWDSWRFWECLAAGSVALHVDLEKYGVALPFMPVNWEHYIGIDFENLDRDIARFLALDAQALARIGAAGRQWALDFYSPAAAARQFLRMLSNLPDQSTHA